MLLLHIMHLPLRLLVLELVLLRHLLVLDGHWPIINRPDLHQMLKLPRLDLGRVVLLFKNLHKPVEHLSGLLCLHGAVEIGFVALEDGVKGELGDGHDLALDIKH